MREIVALLLAIASAVAGQVAFGRARHAAGIGLYLASLPFAIFALRRYAARFLPDPVAGAGAPAPLPAKRRVAGLLVLFSALAACPVALALFRVQAPKAAAWLVYVLSAALFLVAALLLSGKAPGERGPTSRITAALLVLILGVAVALRLYRLAAIPFGSWYDEANAGLCSMPYLHGGGSIFSFEAQVPAHYFQVLALSFHVFGVGPLAIRVVSAAFGIAGVLLAFYVGREAYDDRFGLLFAFLTAVGRWSITFSRIGLVAIPVPFFVLASLLFLIRARRRGRLLDFALAGVTIGTGLCFYLAFRLFAPVVLVFLVGGTIAWFRRPEARGRKVLGYLARAGLFALGIALTTAPVIQFAIQNPEAFGSRTSQVSIFNKRDEPNLVKAIASNAVRHLLMFNDEGDRNGRHNLPGAPMLDPATGVFFVLGLGLALSRPFDPIGLLFLVLFPSGLLGGILSLDFEAPQSVRSIAAMPAVYYFAALAADALRRFPVAGRRALGTTLVSLAALCALVWNTRTYFVDQARDKRAYAEHSSMETAAAHQLLAAHARGASLYASVFIHQHLVVRFLAPKVETRLILDADAFPVQEPGDKPVAIVVDPDNMWIVEEARRCYPNARIVVDRDPTGEPILHTILLEPTDVRSIQGLVARFHGGKAVSGEPAVLLRGASPDGVFASGAPPLPPPFASTWDGVLVVPLYGRYELSLEAPGKARLLLDEKPVLELPGAGRSQTWLAQGRHAIRIEAEGGAVPPRLLWSAPSDVGGSPSGTSPELRPIPSLFQTPPVDNHGLLATFYKGERFEPPVALARVDRNINAYYHVIPIERPYSVVWAGQVETAQAGTYEFGVRVMGRAKVFVDDRQVADAPEPSSYTSGTIDLTAGRHRIRVLFVDDRGASRMHLYWKPPGGSQEIVPPGVLWPYP